MDNDTTLRRKARIRRVSRYLERIFLTYIFGVTTPLITANAAFHILTDTPVTYLHREFTWATHIYYAFWFLVILMTYGLFMEASRAMGRCLLHRELITFSCAALVLKLVNYWYDVPGGVREYAYGVILAVGLYLTCKEAVVYVRARSCGKSMYSA